jgi:hypothetical protein
MAMALRPWPSAVSITSRYGSQALAEGLRPGGGTRPGAAESVDTPLAGFRRAGGSVNTPVAGFGGGPAAWRPHREPRGLSRAVPGGRRWPSMRRSDQPSRPRAITYRF